MAEKKIGVILNGVTGRMGTNQHLIRSILAIRSEGGVLLKNGDRIMPEPILVGRNEDKLKKLCATHGLTEYSTDLDSLLKDKKWEIYFDSQTTNRRVADVKKAIAAGKAIYCEKPTAENTADAVELSRLAVEAGVKNGVVQDKLWLPGLVKLKMMIDSGFFGEILSVRGEFGYWVFDGVLEDCQRPSWNYRKEDGGGIILDMFPHWRYLIDNLFGNVTSVTATSEIHIKKRIDEKGDEYDCTAEDAAYATFKTDKGIVCHFNSSWCVRVRRDDLLTIQVDGTKGSAVASLRDCVAQSDVTTPKPVWNPDIDNTIDFFGTWQGVPSNRVFENAFKIQWELFLKHYVADEPFRWSLLEGAKGLQLADAGYESCENRRWIDLEKLG